MRKSQFSGLDLGFRIPLVSDFVDNSTGALVKFAKGGPLGDFLSSTAGKAVLTAFSGGVYAALAPAVGAQLASVAFAIPGLAKGDDFAKSWLVGFADRVSATISILAPSVAEGVSAQISAQLQPAIDSIEKMLPDLSGIDSPYLPKFSLTDLAKQAGLPDGSSAEDIAHKLGVPTNTASTVDAIADKMNLPDLSIPKLASKLGVRQDVAIYAKSVVLRKLIPEGLRTDPLSGVTTVLVGAANEVTRALGVPEGFPVPSTFPAPGSVAYLLSNPISDGVTTWLPGSQVTILRSNFVHLDNGILKSYAEIRNLTGGIGQVPMTCLSETPVASSAPIVLSTLLNKITFNADGSVFPSVQNNTTLNDILNAMKADKTTSAVMAASTAKWLASHGIAPGRLIAAAPVAGLVSKITLNDNGEVLVNIVNSATLNNVLNAMKWDKSTVVHVPASVAKWLSAHGIAGNRLMITQVVPLHPDVAAVMQAANPSTVVSHIPSSQVIVDHWWTKVLRFLGLVK